MPMHSKVFMKKILPLFLFFGFYSDFMGTYMLCMYCIVIYVYFSDYFRKLTLQPRDTFYVKLEFVKHILILRICVILEAE